MVLPVGGRALHTPYVVPSENGTRAAESSGLRWGATARSGRRGSPRSDSLEKKNGGRGEEEEEEEEEEEGAVGGDRLLGILGPAGNGHGLSAGAER